MPVLLGIDVGTSQFGFFIFKKRKKAVPARNLAGRIPASSRKVGAMSTELMSSPLTVPALTSLGQRRSHGVRIPLSNSGRLVLEGKARTIITNEENQCILIYLLSLKLIHDITHETVESYDFVVVKGEILPNFLVSGKYGGTSTSFGRVGFSMMFLTEASMWIDWLPTKEKRACPLDVHEE